MSNILDNSQPRSEDAAALIESKIHVEIVIDENIACPLQIERIRAAVIAAATSQGYRRGELGVRITDDITIHRINRDHLGHDYPTDVISFDYGSQDGTIEGELVASAETAATRARELGWNVEHELVLYLVHGTLHIAGLDDLNEVDRRQMRGAECQVMGDLGIETYSRFAPDTADHDTADNDTADNEAAEADIIDRDAAKHRQTSGAPNDVPTEMASRCGSTPAAAKEEPA